jgi:transposase-like protein
MGTPAKTALKRPKRSYTAEDKANALVAIKANAGNIYRTSRETGIPRQTLMEWAINERGITDEVTQIQHEKEADHVDLYRRVTEAYLNHALDPAVVQSASGVEAVKSAAIATDKRNLLLNLPTEIVESRTIDSRQVLVLLQQTIGINVTETAEAGSL